MPGPVIEEVNEEELLNSIKEQMKLQVSFPFSLSLCFFFVFLKNPILFRF